MPKIILIKLSIVSRASNGTVLFDNFPMKGNPCDEEQPFIKWNSPRVCNLCLFLFAVFHLHCFCRFHEPYNFNSWREWLLEIGSQCVIVVHSCVRALLSYLFPVKFDGINDRPSKGGYMKQTTAAEQVSEKAKGYFEQGFN
jgi:hypothetical protein